MKKVVFVLLGALLLLGVVAVGCTKSTTTHNVTGVVTGISQNSVTVKTPAGTTETIPFTPSTSYQLNGAACSLDNVKAIEIATNTSYDCTVVVNDETGAAEVFTANASKYK